MKLALGSDVRCYFSMQKAMHLTFATFKENLLLQPFLCSVNWLDPGVQTHEGLSGTNSWAVLFCPGKSFI